MVSTRTTPYQAMVALLKKARIQKKLSQRAVAKLCGKSQSYVTQYERCETRLDIIDYYGLARLLEVSDEEIIKTLHKYYNKHPIDKILNAQKKPD